MVGDVVERGGGGVKRWWLVVGVIMTMRLFASYLLQLNRSIINTPSKPPKRQVINDRTRPSRNLAKAEADLNHREQEDDICHERQVGDSTG
jgi:hypothetical protein